MLRLSKKLLKYKHVTIQKQVSKLKLDHLNAQWVTQIETKKLKRIVSV